MQRSQPEVVGLWHGRMQLSGCPELFQAHPQAMGWCGAGFLVLGMVGMPSQKTRWCWALLQHVQASPSEPRSSCNELWLLQKDAFCKDETMSTTTFCFTVLRVKRPPWIRMLWCVGLHGSGRWAKWRGAIQSRLPCALQRPGWHGFLIPSGPLLAKLIVQHHDTSVPPCFMQPLKF